MGYIGMPLDDHIVEQQQNYPEATGDFTGLMTQLTSAARIISQEVKRSGFMDLSDDVGLPDEHKIQRPHLNRLVHDTMIEALQEGGHVCVIASEDSPEPIYLHPDYPRGQYAVLFDSLDVSANIDAGTIGTIFSVHHKITREREDGALADLMQPGHRQVAAGYIVYGSTTMFVFTTGTGVHGYTMSPTDGIFRLTHEDIRIPAQGNTYSVNSGHYPYWQPGIQRYIDYMQEESAAKRRPYSLRYIGSLVADFHRTLLKGGIFFYPLDTHDASTATGKLRLLYQAAPLAMVVQEAGGRASTGRQDILDIEPTDLHQQVPLFIGSEEEVVLAEQFLQGQR